jgi:hypothetical protein
MAGKCIFRIPRRLHLKAVPEEYVVIYRGSMEIVGIVLRLSNKAISQLREFAQNVDNWPIGQSRIPA